MGAGFPSGDMAGDGGRGGRGGVAFAVAGLRLRVPHSAVHTRREASSLPQFETGLAHSGPVTLTLPVSLALFRSVGTLQLLLDAATYEQHMPRLPIGSEGAGDGDNQVREANRTGGICSLYNVD